ncbi:MAG: SAM-dependent methyltransferase [Streptosporangiaceae bacterium]
MRAVTEKLAARGFGVRSPDWEADNVTPDITAKVRKLYEGTKTPSAPRARTGIPHLFGGPELVPPGLANVSEWRNDFMPEQPG